MKKTLLMSFLLMFMAIVLSGISLEESIAKARQNNKNLLMAMEDVKKAEQTYNDVRAACFRSSLCREHMD
jgi:hypothetical protein